MLVLTRSVGQEIVIEGVGTIKVVRINTVDGEVRLGLNAPGHDIYRGELYESDGPKPRKADGHVTGRNAQGMAGESAEGNRRQ